MNAVGIIKRVVPFFLTFAAGLFIASFFISIALPSFNTGRSGRRHECRKMRMEMQQLREENQRLRAEKAEILSLPLNIDEMAPPPPPAPPRPFVPTRPAAPAHVR